jgi:hypothetical protein
VDKDEALKLALEALQWNWGGEPLPTLELQAINAIKEALAQSDDLTIAYMAGLYDGKNKYAPQREWVGLTDEEKSDLWCKSTGQNCVNEDTHPSAQIMNLVIRQQGFNFAKAIEAKLKEKNT